MAEIPESMTKQQLIYEVADYKALFEVCKRQKLVAEARIRELEQALIVAMDCLLPCNPQDPALQALGECPAAHPNCCGSCEARHLARAALAALHAPEKGAQK